MALASGDGEIAQNAKIVSSLDEAVSDCQLVVGSSARSRTLEWPMLEPRECGRKFVEGFSYLRLPWYLAGKEPDLPMKSCKNATSMSAYLQTQNTAR